LWFFRMEKLGLELSSLILQKDKTTPFI
jgi:hypothetical protein